MFSSKPPSTFTHPKTGRTIELDDDILRLLPYTTGYNWFIPNPATKQVDTYKCDKPATIRKAFDLMFEAGPRLVDAETGERYWRLRHRRTGTRSVLSEAIADHLQEWNNERLGTKFSRLFMDERVPYSRAMAWVIIDLLQERHDEQQRDGLNAQAELAARAALRTAPPDDPREASPDDLDPRNEGTAGTGGAAEQAEPTPAPEPRRISPDNLRLRPDEDRIIFHPPPSPAPPEPFRGLRRRFRI